MAMDVIEKQKKISLGGELLVKMKHIFHLTNIILLPKTIKKPIYLCFVAFAVALLEIEILIKGWNFCNQHISKTDSKTWKNEKKLPLPKEVL